MTYNAITLRDELKEVGVLIENIYDLVNSSKSYPAAIPILIDFLKANLDEDNLKEGIIRALAVKEAKGKAGETLLQEFFKTPKDKMMLRWAIGNTMAIVMTENEVDKVLEIVQDKENGIARQQFVLGLGKFKSEKVENVLINLLDDDVVAAHALDALGKLQSKKAITKINNLLYHSNPLLRKEAQKALKRIA